jgi:hypothetical protein
MASVIELKMPTGHFMITEIHQTVWKMTCCMQHLHFTEIVCPIDEIVAEIKCQIAAHRLICHH